MDEVRNQLKSQNLSTVSPTAFGEVGGRVFPDNPSIEDINALIQIVKGWRAVHLPSLGSPISKSCVITSQTGDGTMLSPLGNEIYHVQNIAFQNNDVSNSIYTVQIVNPSTGVAIPVNLNADPSIGSNTLTLPSGETLTVNLDITLDSNHALYAAVVQGDPASSEMVSYHYLRSQ
jgi:hypothetical protein